MEPKTETAANVRESEIELYPLTDEHCDEFRRLRLSFKDMVRAIYQAGYDQAKEDYDILPADHPAFKNIPDDVWKLV